MLPEITELMGLAGLPVLQRMQDEWWRASRGGRRAFTVQGRKNIKAAIERYKNMKAAQKPVQGRRKIKAAVKRYKNMKAAQKRAKEYQRIIVRSESPFWIPRAKGIGGRWDRVSKTWSFNVHDLDRVRDALRFVGGAWHIGIVAKRRAFTVKGRRKLSRPLSSDTRA